MCDFELDSDEVNREFVIVVPLPSERIGPDSPRPKRHRYRALDVALAGRLQSFRAEHDLSQAEVAVAVGAGNKSVVAEWENAASVPSGVHKRRLIELPTDRRLEGRLSCVVRSGVPEAPCWWADRRRQRPLSRPGYDRNRRLCAEGAVPSGRADPAGAARQWDRGSASPSLTACVRRDSAGRPRSAARGMT